MADINTALDNIEVLRDKLSSLIQTKGELLDPEVLKASVMLDKALNEYDKFRFKTSI
ncbi:MAG TPA: aspartyl-phosphate phosphatase Spo0E family protein [Clostridia bacterium]|nr:aspartyl-phosphate phosphatase Spo0E family protein [Clostridia bacterium]